MYYIKQDLYRTLVNAYLKNVIVVAKKVKAEYKVYGTEDLAYMSHVFHCNLNLREAKECNREECEFFKSLTDVMPKEYNEA